jgi:hypothetical protein
MRFDDLINFLLFWREIFLFFDFGHFFSTFLL